MCGHRCQLMKLHPDISADLEKMGRKPVEVIDPSPGLWGGDPIPGLITIVYECPDGNYCIPGATMGATHTHHALYGPSDEQGSEGMSLYAD
jgi:hypothetical protein